MLTVRSRDRIKYFLLMHQRRDDVLRWKKGQAPLPGEIYEMLQGALTRYFAGFDVVTVPAPSFHVYRKDGYPVWELAKRLRADVGFDLRKLFPKPSGKTCKHYTAWRQKSVQNIRLKPGQFVLVLDDIVITGNTMRVTYEAILKRGSYPCGIAVA